MATNFKDLLSKSTDKIEKPKPYPAGTYIGRVKSREFAESKDKKTPYVRFQLVPTEFGEDIHPDDQQGVELGKKTFNKDFYLTDDAEYRVLEFGQSLGIDTSGRSLGEVIEDCINGDVIFTLVQKASQDGESFYNNVTDVKGAPN